MIDAARLADELHSEQEFAMCLEKDCKLLEAQCKDRLVLMRLKLMLLREERKP